MARHAGELAEIHGLRGCDAVHPAIALAAAAADLVLVTWDRHLAHRDRAARHRRSYGLNGPGHRDPATADAFLLDRLVPGLEPEP